VPFVFYSRKITPENVIRVLQAGAVDAIRKDAFNKEEMLARLTAAQQVHDRKGIRSMRAHGLNVNVTLISKV
jgi:DNA-binding response OmpR family regulator